MQKKNISILSLIFILGLQLFACKPDDEAPLPKPPLTTDTLRESKDFEEVWRKKANGSYLCYGTIITDYNVIYVMQALGAGHSDDIVALDKETGDTLWIIPKQGATSKHKFYDDIFFYEKGDRIRAVEAKTGNILWTFSGQPHFDGILSDYLIANNRIYAFFMHGNQPAGLDSCNLFEIDIMSGQGVLKKSFRTQERNGWQLRPKGFVHWKSKNGNDMLFIQSGSYNWAPNVNQQYGHYLCYDLVGDTVLYDLDFYWLNGDNYTKAGHGTKPVVYQDKVLISAGYHYKASIDLETGATNWKIEIPEKYKTGSYVETPSIVLDGIMYNHVGNDKNFNLFNAETGDLIANNNQLGGDFYASPLRVYDGHVWGTTTEGLYKLDDKAKVVKSILVDELVNGVGGSYIFGMDIDQNNGYIYTTRGDQYIVCYKEK